MPKFLVIVVWYKAPRLDTQGTAQYDGYITSEL